MLVVIRGAGDIATGVALRLYRAGLQIVMCEVETPTSIRRTVCFSEAVRQGEREGGETPNCLPGLGTSIRQGSPGDTVTAGGAAGSRRPRPRRCPRARSSRSRGVQ